MGVTVISDGTMGAHTTVFERRGGIGAYGIQVVLGAMPDGRIQPSEQDNSGTTATATSLPTPQPTTTADPSATTTSSSGGVSTGAAIGIGVGSAAVALLAAGSVGLFFFTRWRRKKRLRCRGTTRTAGIRSSKGGGGGGLSSKNGPPVPPKDMQPYYELSEPERAHLSPVWQSPSQGPSRSPSYASGGANGSGELGHALIDGTVVDHSKSMAELAEFEELYR
ncbi:hypothetical protein N0V85_006812 [Neurospora sp. IMI 360204]|nr:hypothetical protein N0V85_006812 [Neurospora sp. IMI 360204]